MSTEWDDLGRHLNELSSDLGEARLPGPHSARRRAGQRTRRQVAGATLGAVAAAAVGAIVLGGLGPLSTAPPDPADTPTPTPTGDTVAPDDGMALTVEDLEAASGVVEPVGWEPADGPADEPFLCAPSPADADRVIERWFRPSDQGYLHQIIEISTADTARARFDSAIDEVLSCVEERNADDPNDNWLSTVWTVGGIGDGAWLGEYAVPPRGPNGELMIVKVSVVLAGDTVTLITQGGPAMEGHNVGPLPYDIAMRAADRLCTWGGWDCIGDPAPQRLYPEVTVDVKPGWLTIEDVVTAMPFFGTISAADELPDAGGQYGHVCLETANPAAAGATSVGSRQYHDPADESLEPSFFQFVASFESASAADAHYRQVLSSVESCGGQQTAEVSGDGYEGVAWRTSDEFVAFHLGAAINGSSVAVIVIGEPSAAQDELPPEQMQALLDRAGARLADLE